MAKIENEYRPDYVPPPGATLLEAIREQGMTQVELALRIGQSRKNVFEIIRGVAPITPDTALQLERVLSVPARFWNNREQYYREYLARRAEEQRLAAQVAWLKDLPCKEMIKFGYIKGSKDRVELLQQVLGFFQVASPSSLKAHCTQMEAYLRKSMKFEVDLYALAAWLRQGRLLASRLPCQPYQRGAFKDALQEIRALTIEDPEVFVPRMQEISAACGVAVVFVPELPKIRAYGATHWVGGTPIIQLCLRGKKDDILWFTFFHEAGHVVLHGKKKTIFLDIDSKEGKEEEEANKFASEILLPKSALETFVADTQRVTDAAIISFANAHGIAPGIVVGQLHHFKYAPCRWHQKLRRTLVWP